MNLNTTFYLSLIFFDRLSHRKISMYLLTKPKQNKLNTRYWLRNLNLEELKEKQNYIVIYGDSIITKSVSRVKPIQPVAAPATMATDDQSG